jgi:hypothetical protein
MNKFSLICGAFVMVLGLSARGAETGQALEQGASVTVAGKVYVLTKLDSLPYVENAYSKRFKFDSFDNPKLKELREKYRLDEVVAPGRTEFDKQVLLLDWVNTRFKSFGKPSSPARGALEVLDAVEKGNTFFCSHYGDVMVSAAASMGWVDRALALRRPDKMGSGSTEHTSTEIWSNQYGKWVLFDPTFAMWMEKDGRPLSAWEFRQEWFYHDGKDVTFVLNKERKRYHKSDFPVFRQRYAGFGDLVLDGGATHVYAFIGYIPNTNLMDGGPDYGKMFITRDAVCEGTTWHKRDNPANPATEPYFPIDQAALTLAGNGEGIAVSVKTMTPNLKDIEARMDGGEWGVCGAAFTWKVHTGVNRLEVKTVNRFGVDGPVSMAEVVGK